jgi:hypothetical protein
MARKPRSDSASAAVRQAANLARDIDPPEGLALKTKRHKQLWSQITHSRDLESWTELQLHDVFRIVETTITVEGLQKRLESEGYVLESSAGPKPNPLVSIIDGQQKLIMSWKRLHGMAVKTRAAAALNSDANGAIARKEAAEKQQRGSKVISLLA